MTSALGRDVAVVEIEIADHAAVGEHRKIVTCLVAAAKAGRCRCRAHAAREPAGDPARFGVVAADRATHCVENGALHRAYDVPWQVLVAELDGEVGERRCDRATGRRWFVSHRRGFSSFLRARGPRPPPPPRAAPRTPR